VEFALVLPILAFILLGIADFARVFTSMMAVESAAREAADFGAFKSGNWSGDPTDPTTNRAKTEAGMKARACTAASNLTDFVGSATNCSNPSVAIDVLDEDGDSVLSSGTPIGAGCDQAERKQGNADLGPCRVKVDLTYTFDLLIPVGFDFGGVRIGLPSDITFTRSSIFAMSDFSIDK
jgi:hypothetical protein